MNASIAACRIRARDGCGLDSTLACFFTKTSCAGTRGYRSMLPSVTVTVTKRFSARFPYVAEGSSYVDGKHLYRALVLGYVAWVALLPRVQLAAAQVDGSCRCAARHRNLAQLPILLTRLRGSRCRRLASAGWLCRIRRLRRRADRRTLHPRASYVQRADVLFGCSLSLSILLASPT